MPGCGMKEIHLLLILLLHLTAEEASSIQNATGMPDTMPGTMPGTMPDAMPDAMPGAAYQGSCQHWRSGSGSSSALYRHHPCVVYDRA